MGSAAAEFLTGKIGITLTKKGNPLASQGPFLSVVIITRNRAELLSDAVRSTLINRMKTLS